MLAPWALNVSGDIAGGTQVAGALIITVSVVVMTEVARAGPFLKILPALWIAAIPGFFDGASTLFMASNVVLGIALIALSIPRGTIKQRYGSWDRFIV